MDPILVPILGMFLTLFVAPVVTFGFIYLMRRSKNDVEKLRLQREILELELRKEETRTAKLAEENRKYDRILSQDIEKP